MTSQQADYIDCYYSRTLIPRIELPALGDCLDFEVCVIGGGLAGLTTTLELTRRGVKVALLEGEAIGWGASGRNGGFCLAGYAIGLEKLIKLRGEDEALALYRLSMEGVNCVREQHQVLGLPLDAPQGSLTLARRPSADSLKDYRNFMAQKLGMTLKFLDRDAVQQRVRSAAYFEGLEDPSDFHFHPLNYARALAKAIIEAGGAVFEKSPALSHTRERDQHRLKTPKGEIRARQVVFTCGGYTGAITPVLRRALLPIATYAVLTEPLGELIEQIIPTAAAIHDTRRAGDYYRRVEDTRLLWGSRITTRTSEPRNLAKLIHQDMCTVYPELADIKIDIAWSGLMGYARHMMPQIGRQDDTTWHATAFGGHGLNTTAIAGKLIAEAITGETERYRAFAPFGLDWNGGPLGTLAVQGTYWAYQLEDYLRERLSR